MAGFLCALSNIRPRRAWAYRRVRLAALLTDQHDPIEPHDKLLSILDRYGAASWPTNN